MRPHHARLLAWGVLLGLLVVGIAFLVFRQDVTRRHEPDPVETRNVKVVASPASLVSGVTSTLAVRAEDGSGAPADAWTGATLEAWLVRSDLAYASHLRTDVAASSSFPLDVRPTQPGSYRLVAVGIAPGLVTLGGTAFQVRGRALDVAPDEQSAGKAGYETVMRTIPDTRSMIADSPVALTFTVSKGGTPATLGEHAGARGSVVAFRDGGNLFVRGVPQDTAFLPSPAAAAFTLTFPEPGRYRVFFQFEAAGQQLMEARWIEVGAAR